MSSLRRAIGIALASGCLLVPAAPAAAQSTVCGAANPGYARLLLADPSLRAYYRLDEPAGPVACDLAGSPDDGRYSGVYSLGHRGALAADGDAAARFAGAGTIRIPSSPALNPTAALTLEAWVQPASTMTSETVLRKDGQYLLRLSNGRVVFRVWTSAGYFELASTEVMRTAYHQHLMAVFYGTGMRIYRNGSQIAWRAASGTVQTTDSALYLASSGGGYDHYAGDLDEIAVYGAALSSSTLTDHYLAARPPADEATLGCGYGGFEAGVWPGGCWRPYSVSSPFNRRLPAAPRVAADSGQVVARLLGFGSISHLEAGDADTEEDYAHPTFYARAGDPLFELHCFQEGWGRCAIEGHRIRVPDAARAAAGGDRHLTVVDQDSGWEYDLWQVRSKPAGGGLLEFRWGGRTRIDGDGLGSGATAAQFGSLAGIVRVEELAAGRIDHALFMTAHCDAGRAVYPARGVGRGCAELGLPVAGAPPMGAHFQLALSRAQIDALPVAAWKKTILRAMASYGMFLGDTGGGSWGIKRESGTTYTSFGYPNRLVEFARANDWQPFGDLWVGNLRDDIDWATHLRLLDPCVSQRTC
jgi:hypothetical protein